MTKRQTVICDKCNKEITKDAKYVDASVYGVDFHTLCIENMSAFEFIRMAGLDDIYSTTIGPDQEFDKLVHQDWFNQRLRRLTSR